FEVVPDPFPSPPRARILVIDDDPTTVIALQRAELDADIETVADGWTALDRVLERSFDVIIAAIVLGPWRGATFYRAVAQQRPEQAARIVFLATQTAVDQAPPSTALARVISRPVDPQIVQDLLRRWRPPPG